jgi:hypothetical protein
VAVHYHNKSGIYLEALLVGTRCGSTIKLQKQTPEYGIETSDNASQNEVQNSTIDGGKCIKAKFGKLTKEGHNCK